MKLPPLPLALALAASLGAAEAPPAATKPAATGTTEITSLASLPPSPLVTKMKQIRATLDDVFKARDSSSARPDFRANPFHLPGTSATAPQPQATAPGGRPATPPETEPARLRRLASGLNWGVLERAGQLLITVSGANYRENDSLGMNDPVTNNRVVLRVTRISGGPQPTVTLRLGNSELTLTK
jgi:hypothetical protein